MAEAAQEGTLSKVVKKLAMVLGIVLAIVVFFWILDVLVGMALPGFNKTLATWGTGTMQTGVSANIAANGTQAGLSGILRLLAVFAFFALIVLGIAYAGKALIAKFRGGGGGGTT